MIQTVKSNLEEIVYYLTKLEKIFSSKKVSLFEFLDAEKINQFRNQFLKRKNTLAKNIHCTLEPLNNITDFNGFEDKIKLTFKHLKFTFRKTLGELVIDLKDRKYYDVNAVKIYEEEREYISSINEPLKEKIIYFEEKSKSNKRKIKEIRDNTLSKAQTVLNWFSEFSKGFEFAKRINNICKEEAARKIKDNEEVSKA